jgi:uncharacterized protein (TIGR03083 family)
MSGSEVVDRADAAGALWDRVIELADGLEPAAWARPTPCPGWSVQDMLAHLSGIQVGFDAGVDLPVPEGWSPPAGDDPIAAWTEAGVAARRTWEREEVLTELRAARAGHVARLAAVRDWSAETVGPRGVTTEDGLLQVRMFDIWVHLQDLHEALTLDMDADDASAAAVMAHRFVLERVPYLFVKRAGAQEGATMRLTLGRPLDVDTVLAVRGGKGVFEPDADPGVCAVTGSPAALTLLCAGRGEPDRYRSAGLLDWSGPRGVEFVERARLF